MTIPQNLDITTISILDLITNLNTADSDVASAVANFDSVEAVTLCDVWTAEECADIERALRYLAP